MSFWRSVVVVVSRRPLGIEVTVSESPPSSSGSIDKACKRWEAAASSLLPAGRTPPPFAVSHNAPSSSSCENDRWLLVGDETAVTDGSRTIIGCDGLTLRQRGGGGERPSLLRKMEEDGAVQLTIIVVVVVFVCARKRESERER
jgi:hypothetical protein